MNSHVHKDLTSKKDKELVKRGGRPRGRAGKPERKKKDEIKKGRSN